ncbi:hypothetical protein [Entomohabitans teleogrylli]|nr:hypothetical protein [Entomohabitans teleogrylli]
MSDFPALPGAPPDDYDENDVIDLRRLEQDFNSIFCVERGREDDAETPP